MLRAATHGFLLQAFIFFLHLCVPSQATRAPPPAPPPTPPLNFTDLRLAIVYPVIQNFKRTITSDPLGLTKTWVGSDICSYRGFFCDAPPDNVSATALASIDFNGFRLAAPTLEGFIDQLPDLALFHANSNNFSGTVPPRIANLPFLYELDLSNNNLSGVFPSVLLTTETFLFLDIRFNFFTGSVPPGIFTEGELDVLFLNNNNFRQNLPENLGSTRALYLTLANNRFTGPIPRSIGNASSTLIEVLFLNNLLTGCLPYEIGLLKKATVFDAGGNLLTGPLPWSLGCLENIEQLNFAGNFLYGQVPESICALGDLLNLSLSDNYFTAIGPFCLRLVRSGVLDLRRNCIWHLPNQRSPSECFWFFTHQQSFCHFPASFYFLPCEVPSPPHPYPHRRLRSRTGSNSVTYTALSRQQNIGGGLY